jgi:hypothetical protein
MLQEICIKNITKIKTYKRLICKKIKKTLALKKWTKIKNKELPQITKIIIKKIEINKIN